MFKLYFLCMNKQNRQQGLTLIELTVVLLILVMLSTIALRSTSGLQDQTRWEQTKSRYEAIRHAILGNPGVLINGQPDISGFVADVGRLPACLRELLEEGYCPKNTFCDQTACDNDTPGSWVATGYHWNGPYLVSSQAASAVDAFSDGWGNSGSGNYGWAVGFDSTATSSATTLTLQSLGKDGASGGADVYDKDYPQANATINQTDWQVDLGGGVFLQTQLPFAGRCSVSYASAATCEIAGGQWSGACTDSAYTNRYVCALNAKTWVHIGCLDGVSTDKASCLAASSTWLSPCSNTDYTSQSSCEAAGATWAPCPGAISAPDSKAFCEAVGGTWTFNSVNVQLQISYPGGSSTATASLEENGQRQLLAFNGFSVTSIPQGGHAVFLQVNGSNDIYPPSCAGLDGDAGGNGISDCVDAGGTLYPNGLCGAITPSECTAGADTATGTLLRDSLDIRFTPHKSLPVIYW